MHCFLDFCVGYCKLIDSSIAAIFITEARSLEHVEFTAVYAPCATAVIHDGGAGDAHARHHGVPVGS